MKIEVNNLTVIHSIVIATILNVFVFILFVAQRAKKLKNKLALCITAVISISFSLCVGFPIAVGLEHGMYENITFRDMIAHNRVSPTEDTLPETPNNCLIIFYKYGCEDCEAIYEDLSNALKQVDRVYWVSSRSKQGQKLLQTYPVKVVPTGVYIYNDSTTADPHYVKKVLYTHEKENTVLYEDNINRLIEIKERNQ